MAASVSDPFSENPPAAPLLICQLAVSPDKNIRGADPVGREPSLPKNIAWPSAFINLSDG